MKHTKDELRQWQALPLNVKVRMTASRIRGWVNEFGEEGVYISFSGGKDSTVLLDIVRNVCKYDRVPAVFVDVPTQFPELKQFAQTFDNVTILKPKISFMQVCEKYGFPLISKEVSGAVYDAQRYLTRVKDRLTVPTDRQTDRQVGTWAFADVVGIPRRQGAQANKTYQDLKKGVIPEELDYLLHLNDEHVPARAKMLCGELIHKEKGVVTEEFSKRYDKSRYKFFLEADFQLSDRCCKVMKKSPLHTYGRETGRMPMTAQMAEESELRTSHWLKNGCNGFDMKSPISNPMSFWTENDVLEYIVTRGISICSVYGDIVEDFGEQIEGQMHMADYGLAEKQRQYKCTGCKRTGCMLCGFGCHMEKPEESRFLLLKKTHPKMYALLDVIKNNGVTFREAIEWTNEHGNLNITL